MKVQVMISQSLMAVILYNACEVITFFFLDHFTAGPYIANRSMLLVPDHVLPSIPGRGTRLGGQQGCSSRGTPLPCHVLVLWIAKSVGLFPQHAILLKCFVEPHAMILILNIPSLDYKTIICILRSNATMAWYRTNAISGCLGGERMD